MKNPTKRVRTAKKVLAAKRPAKVAASPAAAPRVERAFPIVGIGASAGGLEALEAFLSHVPDASGMAFVVIQHMDPTQKGMLPELLQRITPMQVLQAGSRMAMAPNTVYVIPPNKHLSIQRGKLMLSAPEVPRGHTLVMTRITQTGSWAATSVGQKQLRY